ncbi:MAG: TrpB-like pyridoxal phosphate-dependent enzyme [Firmicutes bacterium]|nr:TrpB-like pyridoxal phosphate-dependent enzyme [Bacillota bacterium]
MKERNITLPLKEMPRQWYNIQADLPTPLDPPLHPGTKQPIGPDDLKPIFPMGLIMQEVSQERFIDIPEEVMEIYSLWRPSPLYRAYNLERALGTPAKIYYKNEGVSPTGSHKPNTAVPQAYYNKQEGKKRLATETGAGQWGCSLAMACNYFDMECEVYMVKVSYGQKPYRRSMMEMFGAKVHASPTNLTKSGRDILAADPNSLGSLGIAISEAVEDAAGREDSNYSLGSVLNHVMLHQTIIGQEAKKQLALVGEYPDYVVGCCGGGSNFAGIALPFIQDNLREDKNVRCIGVEPAACPTFTKGKFTYDFGDVAGLTPLLKMYTLGHNFMPPGIHAGGLRYHGQSPILSRLYHDKLMEARAVGQEGAFEAALTFTKTEGIVPAPESSHAIKGAIDLALECKEAGEEKTILFNLSGHGHFDMTAYDDYLAGKIKDVDYPQEMIDQSIARLNELLGN